MVCDLGLVISIDLLDDCWYFRVLVYVLGGLVVISVLYCFDFVVML